MAIYFSYIQHAFSPSKIIWFKRSWVTLTGTRCTDDPPYSHSLLYLQAVCIEVVHLPK